MRRLSSIMGVVLVFFVATIVFDLLLQGTWKFVSGSGAPVPNWLRYLTDPSVGAIVACLWVWWIGGRLPAHGRR